MMDPLAAKTVAAATGATVTALTMTPFDVVKTRMQTQLPSSSSFPRQAANDCCQPSAANCVRNMSTISRPLTGDIVCLWDHGVIKSERVNGFWDALARVVRTEGASGLWRGAGTSLAMGVPSATLYMVAYDHLLKVAVPAFISNPSLVPLTSGILARAAVSTLVSPLELLRTNLQATPLSPAHTQSLRSVSRDLRQLVRSQGTRALWRGLGPTLWRDVPFSGIYWSNYELVKKALHRNGYTGSLVSFISGATGGTIAAVLTSPFDVLKTRQQALVMSSRRGNQPATFALSLLSKIVQKEGIQVLFQGLSPRIAKIAPACGIMIACFEGLGSYLTRNSRQVQ